MSFVPTHLLVAMSDLFCASDWISCGLLFSQWSTTQAVKDEMKRLLAVPRTHSLSSVSSNFTVGQLLDETLPPVDPALNILFSKQLPVAELPGHFSYWTVPTSCNARCLLDQFGQAWFDGSASVIHTSHPHVALPLWVLSHWNSVSAVIEGQQGARHQWHAFNVHPCRVI